MNGANNLAEADAGPQHLCPICLRKLHFNVQFNPVTRYEELAKFYKAHTDKPMVIQLGGPASVGSSADTIALTAKRLEITKTALTTAGVPTSVISILHNDDSVSSSSTTDDDEQSDIDSSAITISLTSNQSCR